MKPYNDWLIIGCSGAAVLWLHAFGRYVGIGINLTHSAPCGIYFYYPFHSPPHRGMLVSLSLTQAQAEQVYHCIPKGYYGLKQIAAVPGNFLVTVAEGNYACPSTIAATHPSHHQIMQFCRFLGVCLKKDHRDRPLPCRHWHWEKIPPHFFYLRSVLSDRNRHKNGCDSRYFGLVQRNHLHHRLVYLRDKLMSVKRFIGSAIAAFYVSLIPQSALAAQVLPHKLSLHHVSAERGYWFYKTAQAYRSVKSTTPFQCNDHRLWQVDCGFVDPRKLHLTGPLAYQFEQTQYHALLNAYVLQPNNLKAALHWQQFNQWVLRQSVTAAYAMQFTISQHPELDNALNNPFSQFGHLVLRHLENKNRRQLLDWLSKSSFFVFFSRSNCAYCQAEAPIIHRLSEETAIPVWNASLDAQSLPTFTHSMTSPDTLKPASQLHVNVVPTVFLYLPRASLEHFASFQHDKRTYQKSKHLLPVKNGGIWLRLATGLTSENTLESRLINFVLAYRHALISGLKRGISQTASDKPKRLLPDFSYFRSLRSSVS